MINLETEYMGLRLKNPVIASSSPLSDSLEGMKRLEEAGAAAIVTSSLFEEQINQTSQNLKHFADYGSESYSESLNYFPNVLEFNVARRST